MIDWKRIDSANGVIFDCDGTLVDSMPVHYLAWHRIMTEVGLRFEEDRFYALGGMPTDRIIELLSREQQVPVDPKRTAHRKEQAFLELIHLLERIEPVVEVVRCLRGRKPISVASGGFREIVLRQLSQVQIADWFDVIVAAEDTVRHKPEPDVFLETANRMGVPAEQCLVFEDSDLGIEAARRAGMDWIDVRSFFRPKRIPIPIS
ncbi:MAG: HAD-IA family hydrolase [Planctomycetes bacterium]|jgi:beta-phosphoglucomutase family hydrolase|nr:HAD-IA family hydrolase [Planctomycetota bacterium]